MSGLKEAIEKPCVDGVYLRPLAVTPEQAAQLTTLSPYTLADYRAKGIGPKYLKTSPGRTGLVLYRISDLEAWLEELVVGGDSDEQTQSHC